jgi:hypothetical protein
MPTCSPTLADHAGHRGARFSPGQISAIGEKGIGMAMNFMDKHETVFLVHATVCQ